MQNEKVILEIVKKFEKNINVRCVGPMGDNWKFRVYITKNPRYGRNMYTPLSRYTKDCDSKLDILMYLIIEGIATTKYVKDIKEINDENYFKAIKKYWIPSLNKSDFNSNVDLWREEDCYQSFVESVTLSNMIATILTPEELSVFGKYVLNDRFYSEVVNYYKNSFKSYQDLRSVTLSTWNSIKDRYGVKMYLSQEVPKPNAANNKDLMIETTVRKSEENIKSNSGKSMDSNKIVSGVNTDFDDYMLSVVSNDIDNVVENTKDMFCVGNTIDAYDDLDSLVAAYGHEIDCIESIGADIDNMYADSFFDAKENSQSVNTISNQFNNVVENKEPELANKLIEDGNKTSKSGYVDNDLDDYINEMLDNEGNLLEDDIIDFEVTFAEEKEDKINLSHEAEFKDTDEGLVDSLVDSLVDYIQEVNNQENEEVVINNESSDSLNDIEGSIIEDYIAEELGIQTGFDIYSDEVVEENKESVDLKEEIQEEVDVKKESEVQKEIVNIETTEVQAIELEIAETSEQVENTHVKIIEDNDIKSGTRKVEVKCTENIEPEYVTKIIDDLDAVTLFKVTFDMDKLSLVEEVISKGLSMLQLELVNAVQRQSMFNEMTETIMALNIVLGKISVVRDSSFDSRKLSIIETDAVIYAVRKLLIYEHDKNERDKMKYVENLIVSQTQISEETRLRYNEFMKNKGHRMAMRVLFEYK